MDKYNLLITSSLDGRIAVMHINSTGGISLEDTVYFKFSEMINDD